MTNDLNADELEALFHAARGTPDATHAWLDRVAQQAGDALAPPARPRASSRAGPRADPRMGRSAAKGSAFGGWWGLGGMVAAGLAGLWIGVAPPAALPDPLELVAPLVFSEASGADDWLSIGSAGLALLEETGS